MGAKIICMASAKGGSGKTVLTATFGTFLAGIGKKVLLIDTDAATNGLTLLYIKEVTLANEYALSENRRPRGIYDLASAQNPVEIVKLKDGPHLIPASYQFKNTEEVLLENYSRSLTDTLSFTNESYDFIFLDAQAGSDVFAHVAMSRAVSDQVVIVSEYDPMSAAGVERLKGLFREDLTYFRTWVLLNKMLPDFVQSFSDFLEVARYLSPIPWDPDVVRAYARRRLALDQEYGNEYTLAVMQSIKGLLGDELSEDIESWTNKRATMIREPIEEQYRDAEEQLKALLLAKKQIEQRRATIRTRATALTGLAISLVASILFLIIERWGPIIDQRSPFNLVLIVGTIVAVTFPVLALLFTRAIGWSSAAFGKVDMQVEQARLDRREMVLQNQLNKLEILRTADLETLIKNRRKGSGPS